MSHNKIFVILGMHRSGTSAIARALKVFDIELGQNLMPAFEGVNEKGFWEDLDIYKLNEEMLSFLDCSWDSLKNITELDIQSLVDHGYLDKAVELLQEKISKSISGKFGFKDPRVTKLFGFWNIALSQVDASIYYVFAVRNPINVSESLRKRDFMSKEKSLHLWLEYVKTPFFYLKEENENNFIFVDYELLMSNPLAIINDIEVKFNLIKNESDLNYYTNHFLSKDLKHHDMDMKGLSEFIPSYLLDYYSHLNNNNKVVDLIKKTEESELNSAYKEYYPFFDYSNENYREDVSKFDDLRIEYENLKNKADLIASENKLIKNSRTFRLVRFISKVLGREIAENDFDR